MMRPRKALRWLVQLSVAWLLVVPTVALASPYTQPTQILKETFESTSTAYVIVPHTGQIPSPASWAPITKRFKSGPRGLWCAGSLASAVSAMKYPANTTTWAEFSLSQFADYYQPRVDFAYTMPTLGAKDGNSFSVSQLRSGSPAQFVTENWPKTALNGWTTGTVDLSAGTQPLSRSAGSVVFKFIDIDDTNLSPQQGEGTTIDDVIFSGWKYGPPRNLASSVGTSAIRLGWTRPWRSTAQTSTEERPITYRVWRAPGGTTTWTELTDPDRLTADPASMTLSTPIIGEGVSYRYSVQAWDTGDGIGNGQASLTTATVPAVPPGVTLVSPAQNFMLSTAPILISGGASDTGTGVNNVQVRIRRADGKCLTTLGTWSISDVWLPTTSTNGYATWSRTWTPDAETLALGQIVTITAKSFDGAGMSATSGGVASTVPMSASVSMAGGAPFTTQRVVSAAISAAGATPTKMRWSVDGAAPSGWVNYATTQSVDLGAGDGTKTVTFELSADGGASVAAVASDSIVVHTSVPQVVLVTPVDGFALTSGAVAIDASATDAGGSIQSVQVRVRRSSGTSWDGSSWVAADTWLPASFNAATSTWDCQWTPDATVISAGEIVSVVARAVDGAGLVGTSPAASSATPLAASLSLDGGAVVSTDLDVLASIVATGSPTSMRWRVNGGSYGAPQAFASSISVSLPAGDGTKTVEFELTGPGGVVTASDTIVVHTSLPGVSVSTPVGGFSLKSGTTHITGTATDAGGSISAVDVLIRRADGLCWNGSGWVVAETWLAASTANAYAAWSYDWTPAAGDIAAGKIVTVSARAFDEYGLSSTTAGVSSAVPVSASIALAGGAPFSGSATIPVAISAVGATHMRHSVDGGPASSWVAFSSASTVTVSPADGVKTVTLEFSSDGGATAAATASDDIVLDGSAPAVVITAPTAQFLTTATPVIQGTAGDAVSGVSGVKVRIQSNGEYFNGLAWQPEVFDLAATSDDGFATWSVLTVPSGPAFPWLPMTVQATALDAVGNSAASGSIVSNDPLDPAALSVAVSRTTVPYAGSASVTGTLTVLSGASAVGRAVDLQYLSGSTWTRLASGTTTASGRVTFSTVKPASKTTYRLVCTASGLQQVASGGVSVTPGVSLSVPTKPSVAYRNRAFTSVVTIKPRHTVGTYPVNIQCYRLESGRWVLRKTVKAKATYSSTTYTRCSGAVALPYTGTWKIRAVAVADSAHAATTGTFSTSFSVR